MQKNFVNFLELGSFIATREKSGVNFHANRTTSTIDESAGQQCRRVSHARGEGRPITTLIGQWTGSKLTSFAHGCPGSISSRKPLKDGKSAPQGQAATTRDASRPLSNLLVSSQNCPEGPRRGLVASDLILTVGESRLVSPISAWRLPVAASAAMRFRARRSSSVLSAALSLGVTERAMSAP